MRHDRLVVRKRLRPRPLSDEYLVRIEYRRGRFPRVYVEAPSLCDREGKRPPHVYADNDGTLHLCLFDPDQHEWSGADRIAETIVSWALEWLFFYEDWLTTGEWKGGGRHPLPKKEKRR
jgi:hypothetical protein